MSTRIRGWVVLILFCGVLGFGTLPGWSQPGDLLRQEAERVAVVAKVRPAVVAIFARGGQGGGSGVLISDDGYALTNFHVVAGSGPLMQCGLPDGVLYDAVLVGLDKVGDVALVKLLPKKEGGKFPVAPMGDSDTVREGDWSLAMGNPFLLATDFSPTVTFGLVSGVHRYQFPSGVLLEYTECIQIDTSINPGNSGGPLFNMKGELIGINGRGSFDKRGRINSGVGYAISINQIKNFLGHLRAGLDTDHASLGATVTTQTDKPGVNRLEVTGILESSDAFRRGLDIGDEVMTFAGRPMANANQLKNVMGLFPRGWRLPLEFRRDKSRKEILVRVMGIQERALGGDDEKKLPPKLPPKIVPKGPPSPAAKFYQPRPGYANYYFNKLEQDRLLAAFKKHGDFKSLAGDWALEGTARFKKLTSESKVVAEVADEMTKDGKSSEMVVRMVVDAFPYRLQPLKDSEQEKLKQPTGSGGFLSALFVYRHFLTGSKGFQEISHGGYEPFYPPMEKDRNALNGPRVDAEVLNSRLGPYLVKWFFSRADQKLLGFEVRLSDNEDPCEVYLGDYRPVDGRLLPHRMTVVYNDGLYGVFSWTRFKLAPGR